MFANVFERLQTMLAWCNWDFYIFKIAYPNLFQSTYYIFSSQTEGLYAYLGSQRQEKLLIFDDFLEEKYIVECIFLIHVISSRNIVVFHCHICYNVCNVDLGFCGNLKSCFFSNQYFVMARVQFNFLWVSLITSEILASNNVRVIFQVTSYCLALFWNHFNIFVKDFILA
uniref:Uncharacterized protein n=1 Tax=Cacopsylla melanoneura TaxID=428564 RepID=A0A8D9B7X7_9HEMI